VTAAKSAGSSRPASGHYPRSRQLGLRRVRREQAASSSEALRDPDDDEEESGDPQRPTEAVDAVGRLLVSPYSQRHVEDGTGDIRGGRTVVDGRRRQCRAQGDE
jgi:hypothetical protein